MPRFSRITKKLIATAVSTDDLNNALYDFQCAIGIHDGDVAGVVFAGPREEEWPTATPERRREMMKHYIDVERTCAGK